MRTIKVSEVIIPKEFTQSTPRSDKIERVKNYVEKHNTIDKPIVVNSDGVLTDNYVRYLVANQCGLEEIPCITQEDKVERPPVTYIIGMFRNCHKKYTWKNTRGIPVKVGDDVLVVSDTKNGRKKVVVTVVDITQSTDAAMLKHKPMIKNLSLKKEK